MKFPYHTDSREYVASLGLEDLINLMIIMNYLVMGREDRECTLP